LRTDLRCSLKRALSSAIPIPTVFMTIF
jgi:hypothetical protein